MPQEPFSFIKRGQSFTHAIRGILLLIKTQHNAWIHFGLCILVVPLGLFLHLSTTEWLALILAGSLLWTAEALNTAIEFLADEISTERREGLRKVKDAAAGAVLLAAFGTTVIGAIIFIPHLINYFK